MFYIRHLIIILLIVGLTLGEAKESLVQASPLMTDGESIVLSTDSAGTTSSMTAASSPSPNEIPRIAGSRITLDAELIGTVVVDGGRSYAVFELKTGQKLVRTGEDIVQGIRLLQVKRNQIEIASGGVSQEIGLGSWDGTMALAKAKAASVDMDRFLELRKQKIESLTRFRARNFGWKRG